MFKDLNKSILALRTSQKVGGFESHGLASIVFLIIVLNENLPGSGTMEVAVICSATFSIPTARVDGKSLLGLVC